MRHYQTKQIAIGRFKANQFRKAKRYTLLLVLFISALSQTNAQTSGLRIAALNEITYYNSGGLPKLKSNLLSTAGLRKYVNEEKKREIVAATDPGTIIKKEGNDNIKKSVTIKEAPIPVVTTSGTIYEIPGSTASCQYISLQANFKFFYELHGLSAQRVNEFNAQQSIELYKLEKGVSTRSFCIPSGSCTSVNIPIQITGNGLHGAGVASGKGDNLFTVVIPSGYLAPGEYAFIDKSSLTADGNSLKCFAFTVR